MRKVLSVIGAMILMLFLFGCKKNEANETVMATSPAVELNTVETTEETTVPATTESTDIEIKINSENFGEYFELYYECGFQENSFGEISIGTVSWGIHLKDAFRPYLKNAESIAVEIGYTYGFVDYEPDYQNETIILKDISSIDVFEITHVYDLVYDADYMVVEYKVPGILMVKPEEQKVRCPVNLKVFRAQGTLSFSEVPVTAQSENTMPSATRKSTETEKIEISTQNWNTYFEFVELPVFSENPFGEVDTFNLYFRFRLKEEYLERLNPEETKIALEVSYTYGHRYCSVDYESQTYELSGYQNTGKSSKMGELSSHSDGGYYFMDFGVYPEFSGNTIFSYSDFEVLRISGILCLSCN